MAGIDLPRDTYTHANFEEAKLAAAEKNLPIAYIWTRKDSTCPLCNDAGAEFLKAVRRKAILVYLDSKDNSPYWDKLPEEVRHALNEGKYIPKMAVADSENKKLIASINYDSYTADRSSLREFKKNLKD